MAALILLLLNLVASLFKSKSRLEAENAALRQQLTVLQRKVRGRVRFTNNDRLFIAVFMIIFSGNNVAFFHAATVQSRHRPWHQQ